MSYPPDPNNPYGGGPPGNPYGGQPGYGYPPQPQASQPGYGYPTYPGGAPGVPHRMPAQTVTARVLLFVAGSLWGLFGILMLIGGLVAQEILTEMDLASEGAAVGIALLLFLVFGGMAALHIVPAALFGKGGSGCRVTAIIASSLNSVLALLGLLSGASEENSAGVVVSVLWTATAVTTVIFLSMGQTGSWFNRPRY